MKMIAGRSLKHGFTLIETMVATVVLSIGLLGMAAMIMWVIRSNALAMRQTNAVNLAQMTLERLKGLQFDLIGSDSCTPGTSAPVLNGEISGLCWQTALNGQGQLTGTGSGPYVYNLFVKICSSTTGSQTPDVTPDLCATPTTDNPSAELACDGSTAAGEKELRVVVSYNDHGSCRRQTLRTVVVDTL